MKVNIAGKGVIPVINALAPVRNVECDGNLIKRILNFHQFRVYQTSTGLLITKKNVDMILNSEKPIVSKPVEKPVVAKAPVVETPVVEAPKVEPIPEKQIEFDMNKPIEVVAPTEEVVEPVDEVTETPELKIGDTYEEPVIENIEETPTSTDITTEKKIPYKKKKNRH